MQNLYFFVNVNDTYRQVSGNSRHTTSIMILTFRMALFKQT